MGIAKFLPAGTMPIGIDEIETGLAADKANS
jgi:hypothetical protein